MPIPLTVTLLASQLNIGKIGPAFLLPFENFATVFTVTLDDSCEPSSTSFLPEEKNGQKY